jgi:hypothetical protein
MKTKTTDKVIADLKKLFEIDTQAKKDSREISGAFFIYKRHIKRKKAKKLLQEYIDKVKIEDGFLVMQKKTIAYSLIFKIVKDVEHDSGEKKEKEEKGQRQKSKKSKKDRI